MNKIQLLRVMENNTICLDDPKKGELCRSYHKLLAETMLNIPEHRELGDFPNAQYFRNRETFENFIKVASPNEIEDVLEKVLQYFLDKASQETTKKLIDQENEIDNRVNKRRRVCIFLLAIPTIVIITLTLVFNLCFDDDSLWTMIANWVLSAYDCGIGVWFFIYEQKEDTNKKQARDAALGINTTIIEIQRTVAANLVIGRDNTLSNSKEELRRLVENLKEKQNLFYQEVNAGNCVCGKGNKFE